MKKKVFKILGIALLSIVGILLIGLIVSALNSPGKLEPLKDGEGKEIIGSLTEKNFVEIGGIRQGFFIRAENPENPVILFLHGGPGSPALPMTIPYEVSERLEKYFTVCYWEQRGAGMSFSDSLDSNTMTTAQMVEDTRQMTEYLQRRFNQEKIYLIGYSWGSYLGVKTIEKYPENYIAYIGIGQITNQMESEKLAYDYMLRHATEINDKSAVKNLQKFDKNASDFPTDDYIFSVRMSLMNKYGVGFTREKLSMIDMAKAIWFFKGYTMSEKENYLKGMMLSQAMVWNDVIEDNLFESSTAFQIPVYITHGEYDYIVSYTLAKDWLEKIEAPQKEFFTFENSAHSPIIEEPEKFVEIIREIALAHTQNVNLADGTHGWIINSDNYGSSVENFENAENLLQFSLNRAVENPQKEQWTWSEVIVSTNENIDWSGFSGIEITYKADKNLTIILSDSGLQQYNPAAGFFAVLPISQTDTTITLLANNPEHFKQHDWVFEQFPDIRRTIDNSQLYGIKIGTKAIGETTDAAISKFVLKGSLKRPINR